MLRATNNGQQTVDLFAGDQAQHAARRTRQDRPVRIFLLADLTGISDFFSQMGGFVRGLLGRDDSDVPELKPWAKVVFAAYTIIVVPLRRLSNWRPLYRARGFICTVFTSTTRPAPFILKSQG